MNLALIFLVFQVMLAQFVSAVSGGVIGTLVPYLFNFTLKREAGRWDVLLITAVQDIVGSLTLVAMSYKLFLLLGPFDIDANDMCSDAGLA